ncbi:gephyrin-like molybdotransferase Glp [Maritimibacter dapengensis]|uniref:Molybdopterin molybdenumtransferase n=1 Tax=Maritimibacter dapengensis TaxID=2836868 RepID=A0ABS6T435_9RHOB|nr:gephyrin-like molybdotransferase Glp [Maritimibacter dapengensis]MBV7379301.1 molybdopterin molybdotransferase MoeA [Maritimibacter dapengensis]
MITVEDALSRIFDLVAPVGTETVPLADAAGRILATPVTARRDQPPFAASAMDGYALKSVEADPEAMFKVVGEAQAGQRFDGNVGAGQAVRIFTGAPVPEGADMVVIQEDVDRRGDLITLHRDVPDGRNIRPAGNDFRVGDTLDAPRRLSPRDVALIASMNQPQVEVSRRPDVAIIATGDELVMPGEEPGPDQIIASNSFGLKAMLEAEGARVRLLPIARDNEASLRMVFGLAAGADLVITIGGASVGDHDLVGPVAAELGMEQAFYKVAMRPGKPLMAGRLGNAVMVGLPGNPVSAMVCGSVFVIPALRVMLGLPPAPITHMTATLREDLAPNGPRQHYMRAVLDERGIAAMSSQDSALLSVLAHANALIVRPPSDSARKAGETVDYLPL